MNPDFKIEQAARELTAQILVAVGGKAPPDIGELIQKQLVKFAKEILEQASKHEHKDHKVGRL
jgi:hypothetical protein